MNGRRGLLNKTIYMSSTRNTTREKIVLRSCMDGVTHKLDITTPSFDRSGKEYRENVQGVHSDAGGSDAATNAKGGYFYVSRSSLTQCLRNQKMCNGII